MTRSPSNPISGIALLLAGTLLLSGCSSLTRSEFQAPPVEIPDSWQSRTLADQTQLDPWWQSFRDPELNRLIEQALNSNNDLALATLTLRKARLQAGLAEQELYPQLSSSLSASRSEPLDGGDSSRSYSAGLSVSYEADLWGRVSAQTDAARWSALASAEDREATAQSLVATTASLYWQTGYLKQRIALSDDSIAYAEKTLELTRTQYDAGAVSGLDLLQATRSLSSQRAARIELERQLAEVENSLSILLNRPPGEERAAIQRLPDGDLPEVGAGAPAELLIRRPDVKSALYALRSTLASRDETAASYLPTLTLTGQVGESSNALKDLLRDPIGTLGAGLILPFLQWNEMQLNKEIAQVDYESAVVSYRGTLYRAFEDVDNALSAIDHYRQREQELMQQYTVATDIERIYENQYRNGAAGLQDWLDAQDDRRNAEESLLENRYNRLTSQTALYQALGGREIAPELDQPTEMESGFSER